MTKANKITVALADDHTMFRRGLISILKKNKDIEVTIDAVNGRELLNKIVHSDNKPQVCIVDVNMPVLNGYDTVKEIRSFYPYIQILALSMYDDERNIIQMLRHGAHGYVLKDSEPKVLVDAIKKVHKNGFYDSDLITNEIKNSLEMRTQPADNISTSVSGKELAFLKLACTEMTYKEIAIAMDVAERTVDGYRDRLFTKLGVKSRVGLVMYALRKGIISIY